MVLQYIFQNPSKKTQNVVMNDVIQTKQPFEDNSKNDEKTKD